MWDLYYEQPHFTHLETKPERAHNPPESAQLFCVETCTGEHATIVSVMEIKSSHEILHFPCVFCGAHTVSSRLTLKYLLPRFLKC